MRGRWLLLACLLAASAQVWGRLGAVRELSARDYQQSFNIASPPSSLTEDVAQRPHRPLFSWDFSYSNHPEVFHPSSQKESKYQTQSSGIDRPEKEKRKKHRKKTEDISNRKPVSVLSNSTFDGSFSKQLFSSLQETDDHKKKKKDKERKERRKSKLERRKEGKNKRKNKKKNSKHKNGNKKKHDKHTINNAVPIDLLAETTKISNNSNNIDLFSKDKENSNADVMLKMPSIEDDEQSNSLLPIPPEGSLSNKEADIATDTNKISVHFKNEENHKKVISNNLEPAVNASVNKQNKDQTQEQPVNSTMVTLMLKKNKTEIINRLKNQHKLLFNLHKDKHKKAKKDDLDKEMSLLINSTTEATPMQTDVYKSTTDNTKNLHHEIVGDLSCLKGTFLPAPQVPKAAIKYIRVQGNLPSNRSYLIAEYECDRNHALDNSSQKQMICNNREWTGNLPSCLPLNKGVFQRRPCDVKSSICDQICEEINGKATCSCYKGFRLEKNICIDINECEFGNGGCESDCRNTVGSYECLCPKGLRLADNLKNCTDVNECLLRNGHGPCQDHCTNSWGSYQCECHIPGTKLGSDGHTCQDVDECADGSAGCSHICINTLGRVFCECPPGFMLGDDWKTCQDIDECAYEELQDEECLLGCVNTLGSYHCLEQQDEGIASTTKKSIECLPGFILSANGTCEDINECLQDENNCDNCINTFGSFICHEVETTEEPTTLFSETTTEKVSYISTTISEPTEGPSTTPDNTVSSIKTTMEIATTDIFKDKLSSSTPCPTTTETPAFPTTEYIPETTASETMTVETIASDTTTLMTTEYFDTTTQEISSKTEKENLIPSTTATEISSTINIDEENTSLYTSELPTTTFMHTKSSKDEKESFESTTAYLTQNETTTESMSTSTEKVTTTEAPIICENGWIRSPNGECEDIDECETVLCDSCINTPGSFICHNDKQKVSFISTAATTTTTTTIITTTTTTTTTFVPVVCPQGLKMSEDGICVDINECSDGTVNRNLCDKCVNTVGSYLCLQQRDESNSIDIPCPAGFKKMADSSCEDINECKEKTCGCSQGCLNIRGSCLCYCGLGFVLSADNKTCIRGKEVVCPPLDIPPQGYLQCARHLTRIREARHPWKKRLRVVNHAGAICELKCPMGYKMIGEYRKVCSMDKRWIGPDNGTCIFQPREGLGNEIPHLMSFYSFLRGWRSRYPHLNDPRNYIHVTYAFREPKIKCPEDLTVYLEPNEETAFVAYDPPETNLNWFRNVFSIPKWGKDLEAELPKGTWFVKFTAVHPITKHAASCSFQIKVKQNN